MQTLSRTIKTQISAHAHQPNVSSYPTTAMFSSNAYRLAMTAKTNGNVD